MCICYLCGIFHLKRWVLERGGAYHMHIHQICAYTIIHPDRVRRQNWQSCNSGPTETGGQQVNSEHGMKRNAHFGDNHL